MFEGCIRSNLVGAGRGRWVAIEGLEAPSFEVRWDPNMEVECWVFHLRPLEGRYSGIVMRRRVRIERSEAGERRSWDRRDLFAVLWVAERTS